MAKVTSNRTNMSYWMEMSCGKAALALFANCFAAKVWITAHRFSLIGKSKKEADKVLQSSDFKTLHMAQLNNAEYAGPLIAVLLYLHSQAIEANEACFLLVVGSLIHMWGLALIGKMGGLMAPIGAGPRYAGMFLLIKALQVATAKDIGQFSAVNQARYERVGVPGA